MNRNEALDIFEENISDIKYQVEWNWAQKLLLLERPTSKNYNLFQVQSWRYLYEKEELRKNFQPTLRLIEIRRQPKTRDTIDQFNILKAKEYPIEELLPTEVRHNMALCPLHNEKTPSFQIRKDNTFTCYGCQAHGDAIDLYMAIHRADFITAVKALQ